MLGRMRAKKTNQTVVWSILGLLILGLIGFGRSGIGRGSVRSIATVGEENVSVDVYAQAMNRALSDLSSKLKRPITAAEAQSFGVQSNVLQNLLTTAALDNETRKLGISVGDKAVRDQLLKTPAFQGIDGSFDKEAYNYALERSKLSASEYENIIRKQAARIYVQTAIATGLKSEGTQAATMLAFNRERRDFTWAEMTASALDGPVSEPTQAQIEAQYKATPQAYTAPLTREITYAWLSPEMLQDKVAVDEAEIKDSYNLQPERFNKPEKRSLERLVFGTDQEATAARNLLDAGSATFNTLLADKKLTPTDVDLGEVTRGSLSNAAADVVFAADSTGVVGPVQSSLGPALFRINAIIAADVTPYEQARPMLVAELSGDAERRMINNMVTDIDDMLAAGATLEELSKDTDMTLGKISLTANTTDGIAAYENFRKVANSAKPSDFPAIKDLADGGIFALRVDKITDPALKPLSEVKAQVIADWKRAETVRLLMAKAEKLKSELDQGAGFGSLETKAETDVQRSHVIAAIPPALLANIFKKDLEPGQADVVAGRNSVFIARLDKINAFDATLADNRSLIDAIQAQIDAQTGNDLLNIYADALRSQDGITINQAAINQINAQLTGG